MDGFTYALRKGIDSRMVVPVLIARNVLGSSVCHMNGMARTRYAFDAVGAGLTENGCRWISNRSQDRKVFSE